MNSNHFSYFRVKNFKRFKDLEVKDIGQFNLVLGDNNVGKTSLLEALMFDGSVEKLAASLFKRIRKRNIVGNLTDGIWGIHINNDVKLTSDFVSFSIESNQSKMEVAYDKVFKKAYFSPDDGILNLMELMGEDTSEFEIENHKKEFEIENFKSFEWPVDFFEPLISHLDKYEDELASQYSKLNKDKTRSERERFIAQFRSIDESINWIELENISSEKPLLTVESDKTEATVLLPLYGDGLVLFFRLILFINLFSNKKLMVDEIDAGIHHSRMKNYWKVILQSAQENNVQLFATTHNRECIEAYQHALDELGGEFKDEARIITLKEDPKTKDIIAFTNPIEVLESAAESDSYLR